MLSTVIDFIIWILIIETCVILHEIGHALTALLLTKDKVVINLGSYNKNPLKIIKMKRLNIIFYDYLFSFGYVSYNPQKLNTKAKILFYFSGPLFTFIAFIILMCFYSLFHIKVLHYFQIFLLIASLINLIPFKFPKMLCGNLYIKSDGYNIIRYIIRKKKLALKLTCKLLLLICMPL